MPHDDLGRFAWEKRVRDDPSARQRTLCVLLALATYRQRTGRCVVTVATLAEATGHDEARVRASLRWAREAGYIERVVRGHRLGNGSARASEYVLTAPSQPGADAQVETQGQPGANAPIETDLNRTLDPPQPGATPPLNRAPEHGLLLATPQLTSSSSDEHDDDDIDPVTAEYAHRRALLRSAGTADELWTDRHQQRARDRIWDRLGATTDHNGVLDALVTLRVRDPLAYLASLSDDDLADLSHRPEPNGNGSTAATLDRPAIDNCPHCDHLGFTELDDGRLRRCTHTKAPA